MRMRLIPLAALSGVAFAAATLASPAAGGKWLVVGGKTSEILKISGLEAASANAPAGANRSKSRGPEAQPRPIDLTVAEKPKTARDIKMSAGGKLAQIHIRIGAMDYELTGVTIRQVNLSGAQEDLRLTYDHLTVTYAGNNKATGDHWTKPS